MKIIFNLANHLNPASGGLKILLNHLEYLYQEGFDVAVYYYNWIVWDHLKDHVDSKYPLVHIQEITPNDVVIVAEEFLWVCYSELIPRNIPYIIINQGISGSFRSGISYQTHKEIYHSAKKILVNSDHSEKGVIEIFDLPREMIRKFRIGIDKNIYYPGNKQNTISYLSYKNGEFVSFINQYIQKFNDQFNIKKIHLLSRLETASIMQESKLFLSFGGPEGFGLPPLEAAFCGCKVLGFDGYGGKEYWKSPIFTSIPFYDYIEFIKALKKAIDKIDYWDSGSLEYVDFLRDFYSMERARNSIIKIFEEIV